MNNFIRHPDGFKDSYEGNRYRMVSEVILIGSLMQGLNKFTVAELHENYCREIGKMSYRSMYRYIAALEKNGLIEKGDTKDTGGCVPAQIYKWVSWPTAMESV